MTSFRFGRQILKYALLFLMMAGISQWMTIKLYLSSIGQTKQLVTTITTSPLISLIHTKTGVILNSFRIVASSKLYGQMIGVPGKPYMILSSRLNDEFTDSEKEYVVLHEIGHYVYHHTIKEIGAFLLLFAIDCMLIRKLPIWTVPIAAIILSLIFIQYGTHNEYEADHYAVKHITDPNGMITATEKFKNQNFPPLDGSGLKWKLFYRSTPYEERISIANEEIRLRTNKP